MKHNREFWIRHVRQWRTSGLTQAAYCRRHRMLKGTLGYWASVLKEAKAPKGQLVEVGRTEGADRGQKSPIELVVERRYLLRLWPGMVPAHLRDVLSILEDRS
jgi:hypothetical protein